MSLARSRCTNHPGREAAARCPSCRRDFCRECVVDHGGKLLCAACLRPKLESRRVTRIAAARAVVRFGIQAALGIFVAWVFFYGMGRILLSLPDEFHEGNIWEAVEQ